MTLKRIKHAFKEDEYVRIGDVLEVEALPVFFCFLIVLNRRLGKRQRTKDKGQKTECRL
jgi:hypothetical protein